MFRYLVYSWIFSSSLSLCEIPLAAAVIAYYSFDEALGNETVYGVDASEEALWASDMARGARGSAFPRLRNIQRPSVESFGTGYGGLFQFYPRTPSWF